MRHNEKQIIPVKEIAVFSRESRRRRAFSAVAVPGNIKILPRLPRSEMRCYSGIFELIGRASRACVRTRIGVLFAALIVCQKTSAVCAQAPRSLAVDRWGSPRSCPTFVHILSTRDRAGFLKTVHISDTLWTQRESGIPGNCLPFVYSATAWESPIL